MGYIAESLCEHEKIVETFCVHWLAYAWPVFYASVSAGLLLPFAIYEYLRLRFFEQGLTNKRVILKRGIIARQTDEMKLTSIETVEIDQGVFGRLLGFGTVHVTGRGISEVVFKHIDNPMAVKRAIESVSNPVV